MRNIWTIARREYRLYFTSPIAYIVMLVILLTTGIVFSLYITQLAARSLYGSVTPPDTSLVVANMPLLLMFTAPAITMRLLADEHRTGTLELLLTAPLRDWELVIGKWLGAFMFLFTVIVMTLIFPIVLNNLVNPGIDKGVMLSCYLGIILVVGAFLAIGTAMSSFFNNQFAAFFATLIFLIIFWWLIGWPASIMPIGGEVFNYLDMGSHFNSMMNGVVALSDIIYYLSLTTFGLFLSSVAVEMRRWR